MTTRMRDDAIAMGFGMVLLLSITPMDLGVSTMPIWAWVLLGYVAVSVITFIAYGADKRSAMHGRRRTRERTLHLLELAGGWPGALIGRNVFRHKRRKAGYTLVFIAIIALHLAGWWLMYRNGWIALR